MKPRHQAPVVTVHKPRAPARGLSRSFVRTTTVQPYNRTNTVTQSRTHTYTEATQPGTRGHGDEHGYTRQQWASRTEPTSTLSCQRSMRHFLESVGGSRGLATWCGTQYSASNVKQRGAARQHSASRPGRLVLPNSPLYSPTPLVLLCCLCVCVMYACLHLYGASRWPVVVALVVALVCACVSECRNLSYTIRCLWR
jgi:hypothetical protein